MFSWTKTLAFVQMMPSVYQFVLDWLMDETIKVLKPFVFDVI